MSILIDNGKQFYNELVNLYYKPSSAIIPDKLCAGWMATNLGDTVAWVNNKILNPDPRNVANPANTFLGDSRSVMLHKNDIYAGTIELRFDPTAGTRPIVEITQLVYFGE